MPQQKVFVGFFFELYSWDQRFAVAFFLPPSKNATLRRVKKKTTPWKAARTHPVCSLCWHDACDIAINS